MTTAAGRATDCGVIIRGTCAGFSGAGGAAGAAGFSAAGAAGLVTAVLAGAAGLGASTGAFAAGRAGAGCAACSFSSVMAFSTSPGLEIFDRSIFGRDSSITLAAFEEGPCCPAKYFLTRSASSASMELECVFFSVTPTFGSASRISLLLTSSSLARSLIRIFIRPFPSSDVPPIRLSLHRILTVGIVEPQFLLYLVPVSFGRLLLLHCFSGALSSSPGCSPWVVTSASSAGGASSTPWTASASKSWPVSSNSFTLSGASSATLDSPVLSPL